MNWYLKVLKQYADFKGRARRKEYWMFVLFHIIAVILTVIIDSIIGTEFNGVGFFYIIYLLLTIIPGLAVSARRMHDIGKSGAWFLINFIPLIGPFWFLILTCMEGEARSNQWGENPKGIGNNREIDFIGKE